MRLHNIAYVSSGALCAVAVALPAPSVFWAAFFVLCFAVVTHWRRASQDALEEFNRREFDRDDAELKPWQRSQAERMDRLEGKTIHLRQGRNKLPRNCFTPTDLARLNAKRRETGRPPLSRRGFEQAVREAPPVTAPRSDNDWLLWFLLFTATDGSHRQTVDHVGSGLDVFNGLGGTFGGAGATASWTDNDNAPAGADTAATASPASSIAAAGLGVGAGLAMQSHESSASPSSQPLQPDTSDTPSQSESSRSEVSAAEPAHAMAEAVTMPDPPSASPSYSAPDPTPTSPSSYSSQDSSPSYSSPSSYDSGGSSFSGGGDSGGSF